ncbi:Insertion element protein [Pseudonocardia nantongensis]|uniref:Insertion element protein n=1 Tax=Pseudonocardia nantongensis TaxID=1181885 RepID=UPI0039788CB5
MSERAAPFYCPYCGEEDLRPSEGTANVPGAAWWCADCLRTFVVTFVGIGVPETTTGAES